MPAPTANQTIPDPAEVQRRAAARDLSKSIQLLRRAAETLTPPLHPKIEEGPSLALAWALRGFQALTIRPARAQLVNEAIAAELQERYPRRDTDGGLSGLGAETLREIFTAAAARLGER